MNKSYGTHLSDPSKSYQKQIKQEILAHYPTTIRRSVLVSDIISVDHSVNKWLYERWIAGNLEETELNALHKEMADEITSHLSNPNVQVNFVHLDPRITQHPRASY